MKTIQELNSKWYWRLVKVAYIFLAILTLIGGSIGVFLELGTYNPKDKKEMITNFNDYYWRLDEIILKIDNLNGDFSTKNLLSIWTWETVKPTWLLIIFWKYPNANIEWVYKACEYILKENCYIEYDINKDPYSEYQKKKIEVWIPMWRINDFNWYINRLMELKKYLNEYQEDWYAYPFIRAYNQFFETNYDTDRNYRGPFEYFKIFGWFIWILLWIILFTYVVRWTTYYIILWKFNPEK